MQKVFEDLLQKIHGLMYFSEGEYPVRPFAIDVSDENQIPDFLSSYTNTEEQFVKNIPAHDFFSRFKNYLAFGGPDELLNENAERFLELQHFLKGHFETTGVFRIERPGNALIPIFIICKQKNNKGFTGLETTAVET